MAKKTSSQQPSPLWAITAAIFVVAIGMYMSRRFETVPSQTPQAQVSGEHLSFPSYANKQLADRTVNSAQDRAAAILIESSSGSGTFFYLVGAMQDGSRELYASPILLGDRIRIQAVSVGDNSVTVKYLDRPESAPMSDAPSVPTTVNYEFQKDGSLKLVE